MNLLVLLCQFHFSVYKSPPLVPELSYINPVHAFPFNFLKIRFNIILPYTLISSKWSFPSGFLTKKTVTRTYQLLKPSWYSDVSTPTWNKPKTNTITQLNIRTLKIQDGDHKNTAVGVANWPDGRLRLCQVKLLSAFSIITTILSFTFVWPCSVTNFFTVTVNRRNNFTYLYCHETLHVSDRSSVHHQEFIHCTPSNGICHTGS